MELGEAGWRWMELGARFSNIPSKQPRTVAFDVFQFLTIEVSCSCYFLQCYTQR